MNVVLFSILVTRQRNYKSAYSKEGYISHDKRQQPTHQLLKNYVGFLSFSFYMHMMALKKKQYKINMINISIVLYLKF